MTVKKILYKICGSKRNYEWIENIYEHRTKCRVENNVPYNVQ